MTIPNLNESGLDYLRTLGTVSVESESSIVLSGFEADPSEVSAELMKKGYLLREFSVQKSDLEEYFFRLVGASSGPEQAK